MANFCCFETGRAPLAKNEAELIQLHVPAPHLASKVLPMET